MDYEDIYLNIPGKSIMMNSYKEITATRKKNLRRQGARNQGRNGKEKRMIFTRKCVHMLLIYDGLSLTGPLRMRWSASQHFHPAL
jgi:hypothetical protein